LDIDSSGFLVIKTKYGVADIDTAAEMYMQTNVYPFLQKYDPFKYFPYPSLVEKQMESNPVYRIHKKNNQIIRDYYGIESFD